MTLEKITKEAILKLVQGQTFEDDAAMKKHLIPELRKLLILTDSDRVTDDEVDAEGKTFQALHVMDKETMHDLLIAIVMSSTDFPVDATDDFERHWKEEGAKYGVMLTPTECRLFEVQDKGGESFAKATDSLGTKVVEVESIPPLTEVDYEDEKELGGKKYWYQLMNQKLAVFGFLLFVFLLVGLKGGVAILCRVNGQVKTDVTADGAFYYLPGDQGYDRVETGDIKGERLYCTAEEAEADGWERPNG